MAGTAQKVEKALIGLGILAGLSYFAPMAVAVGIVIFGTALAGGLALKGIGAAINGARSLISHFGSGSRRPWGSVYHKQSDLDRFTRNFFPKGFLTKEANIAFAAQQAQAQQLAALQQQAATGQPAPEDEEEPPASPNVLNFPLGPQ